MKDLMARRRGPGKGWEQYTVREQARMLLADLVAHDKTFDPSDFSEDEWIDEIIETIIKPARREMQ